MRIVPNRPEWADLGIVAGLGLLVLLTLRHTYDGWSFLVTGGIALLLGMVVAHLVRAAGQPVIVLAAVTLVVYFAVGVPLVLPSSSYVDGLRLLAAVSITGWKALLTTAPPVATDSGLLVVPYALGLVGGVAGVACARLADRSARRVRPAAALVRAVAPVAVLTALLVLGLALGTHQPASVLLDGSVFAVLSLVWSSWRSRRLRPSARGQASSTRRGLAGVGVLIVAAVVSFVAVPALASPDREVLRDYVVPPLDLSQYPSPLVGFRKYTKDANRLWDQTLFTVTGLPSGSTVRIATLDDYDGKVWGTTDEENFRRVGASLDDTGATGASPAGAPTTVMVTIGAAYATSTDVNPWVPAAGVVTDIAFTGARAQELSASLYYNQQLAAGIVPVRLAEGDSYTLTTYLATPVLPADVVPGGRPALTEDASSLLNNKVATWLGSGGPADLRGQLVAIEKYLHDNGAYTDGGPGESQYLPGHSLGRLTTFVNADQPAGDDEQYAAAFALIANHLGIPARVVLGATPDDQGVVRGSNIHAWVEVHVADGTWVPVKQTDFMPDVTKHPDTQPPQTFEDEKAAVVPPPNAIRLPGTPTDTTRSDPLAIPPAKSSIWGPIWKILGPILRYAGPPIAIIVIYLGVVLGLKNRRRGQRRRDPAVANRFDGAWLELLDLVRDMSAVRPELRGLRFNRGLTRKGQARLLDGVATLPRPADGGFVGLASDIDAVVFGAADPSDAAAGQAWKQIDAVKAALVKRLNLWQRLVVRLNPRSLRPEILPPLPTGLTDELSARSAAWIAKARSISLVGGQQS